MYSQGQLFYNQHSANASQSNQPINVEMGRFLWDKKRKVYFKTKNNYSVISVLARSRHGKSALLKSLAYKFWLQQRKIIVFDPFGEWAKVDTLNFDVDFPDKIFNLKTVSNFAFRISEMKDPMYWAQLGYTSKAIPYLMMLKNHIELHEDNPEKFFELVELLPDNPNDIRLWNAKFPDDDMRLISALHKETARSIREVSHFQKRFFYNPDADERENIDDWQELIKENQFIVIDFGMKGDSTEIKQQASLKCAIVMDKIGYKTIAQYHPIFFIEEASYFVPSESELPFSYSREKFDELNMKKLREGIIIFYINQVHETLGKTVVRDKFQIILGATAETDSIWREVDRKWFKIIQKPRTFVYINEERQEFPFTPNLCKVGC